MAKTEKPPKLVVLDPVDGSRVPFLRGILTRSLQHFGLPFDEAYQVAVRVRQKAVSSGETTKEEIRAITEGVLAGMQKEAVLRRYRDHSANDRMVKVREVDGTIQLFSKAIVLQDLEICALSLERTHQVAAEVERRIMSKGGEVTTPADVNKTTYQVLMQQEGPESALRFALWVEHMHGGVPLIFLIGGATGVGKSTLSADLANRLGIARTQSSDMLREVMRVMLPARLLPDLHCSSFNAHEALPHGHGSAATRLVEGFLLQATHVSLGVEAVMDRACREGISMIIEGVHLHPECQKSWLSVPNAIVVPLILAVLKKSQLKARLRGRNQSTPSRRSDRYMQEFDHIWDLQSFMLEEAESSRIPIIYGSTREETVAQVMDALAERLASAHSGHLVAEWE